MKIARCAADPLRSGEVEHGCESPVHGSTCTCMYAHTACRVLACFVRGVIACNHWLESHSLRQWLSRPHVAVVGGRSFAAIRPRLWPGGFGTFRKRTDMSGDALGTRSLSTPLPMVAEPAQNRATDPYFVLPSSDKRMKGRAISNWSPRSEPAQANGRPLGCALIGPVASNGNLSSSIKRNPRRPSSVSRHA